MNTVETNSEDGQNEDVDGELGMAWWNALSEHSRRYWCFAAKTATPAQAWRYFKAVTLGTGRRQAVRRHKLQGE